MEERASATEAGVPRMCPRCGYDLTGVIESWNDSCPVQGTCSECGLTFTSCDIFSDRLVGPRWSFEHGQRFSIPRLLGTMWRMALVPGPWNRLRIVLTIVPMRLVMLMVVSAMIAHVSLGCFTLFLHATGVLWNARPINTITDAILVLVFPYAYLAEDAVAAGVLLLGWFILEWALMPLLMLILRDTFQRVRVRRSHLLRGLCYSAVMVAALFAAALGGVALMLARPLTSISISPVLMIGLLELWFALWWYSFVKSYLRLPRAGVVVAVLMFVNLLATFTIMLVLSLILP